MSSNWTGSNSGATVYTTFSVNFFTPECKKCSVKTGSFCVIRNQWICRDCLENWAIQVRVVPTGQKDFIEELFENALPHMRTALFRNLSKVFHPDVGGSEALMKRINSAYEKYK